MATEPLPLKVGDSGAYAELVVRPNPGNFTLQYIPALVALLTRAEELNREPLTRPQVEAIRDGASVMVVPPDMAKALDAKRGNDIDPKHAWDQWQEARQQRAK